MCGTGAGALLLPPGPAAVPGADGASIEHDQFVAYVVALGFGAVVAALLSFVAGWRVAFKRGKAAGERWHSIPDSAPGAVKHPSALQAGPKMAWGSSVAPEGASTATGDASALVVSIGGGAAAGAEALGTYTVETLPPARAGAAGAQSVGTTKRPLDFRKYEQERGNDAMAFYIRDKLFHAMKDSTQEELSAAIAEASQQGVPALFLEAARILRARLADAFLGFDGPGAWKRKLEQQVEDASALAVKYCVLEEATDKARHAKENSLAREAELENVWARVQRLEDDLFEKRRFYENEVSRMEGEEAEEMRKREAVMVKIKEAMAQGEAAAAATDGRADGKSRDEWLLALNVALAEAAALDDDKEDPLREHTDKASAQAETLKAERALEEALVARLRAKDASEDTGLGDVLKAHAEVAGVRRQLLEECRGANMLATAVREGNTAYVKLGLDALKPPRWQRTEPLLAASTMALQLHESLAKLDGAMEERSTRRLQSSIKIADTLLNAGAAVQGRIAEDARVRVEAARVMLRLGESVAAEGSDGARLAGLEEVTTAAQEFAWSSDRRVYAAYREGRELMDRLRLSGNLQRQAKAQLESASAEVSTGLEGTIHEAAEDDEMDEELYSFADTVATLRMAVRSEDHDQLQKVIASVVEQRPSTSSAPLLKTAKALLRALAATRALRAAKETNTLGALEDAVKAASSAMTSAEGLPIDVDGENKLTGVLSRARVRLESLREASSSLAAALDTRHRRRIRAALDKCAAVNLVSEEADEARGLVSPENDFVAEVQGAFAGHKAGGRRGHREWLLNPQYLVRLKPPPEMDKMSFVVRMEVAEEEGAESGGAPTAKDAKAAAVTAVPPFTVHVIKSKVPLLQEGENTEIQHLQAVPAGIKEVDGGAAAYQQLPVELHVEHQHGELLLVPSLYAEGRAASFSLRLEAMTLGATLEVEEITLIEDRLVQLMAGIDFDWKGDSGEQAALQRADALLAAAKKLRLTNSAIAGASKFRARLHDECRLRDALKTASALLKAVAERTAAAEGLGKDTPAVSADLLAAVRELRPADAAGGADEGVLSALASALTSAQKHEGVKEPFVKQAEVQLLDLQVEAAAWAAAEAGSVEQLEEQLKAMRHSEAQAPVAERYERLCNLLRVEQGIAAAIKDEEWRQLATWREDGLGWGLGGEQMDLGLPLIQRPGELPFDIASKFVMGKGGPYSTREWVDNPHWLVTVGGQRGCTMRITSKSDKGKRPAPPAQGTQGAVRFKGKGKKGGKGKGKGKAPAAVRAPARPSRMLSKSSAAADDGEAPDRDLAAIQVVRVVSPLSGGDDERSDAAEGAFADAPFRQALPDGVQPLMGEWVNDGYDCDVTFEADPGEQFVVIAVAASRLDEADFKLSVVGPCDRISESRQFDVQAVAPIQDAVADIKIAVPDFASPATLKNCAAAGALVARAELVGLIDHPAVSRAKRAIAQVGAGNKMGDAHVSRDAVALSEAILEAIAVGMPPEIVKKYETFIQQLQMDDELRAAMASGDPARLRSAADTARIIGWESEQLGRALSMLEPYAHVRAVDAFEWDPRQRLFSAAGRKELGAWRDNPQFEIAFPWAMPHATIEETAPEEAALDATAPEDAAPEVAPEAGGQADEAPASDAGAGAAEQADTAEAATADGSGGSDGEVAPPNDAAAAADGEPAAEERSEPAAEEGGEPEASESHGAPAGGDAAANIGESAERGGATEGGAGDDGAEAACVSDKEGEARGGEEQQQGSDEHGAQVADADAPSAPPSPRPSPPPSPPPPPAGLPPPKLPPVMPESSLVTLYVSLVKGAVSDDLPSRLLYEPPSRADSDGGLSRPGSRADAEVKQSFGDFSFYMGRNVRRNPHGGLAHDAMELHSLSYTPNASYMTLQVNPADGPFFMVPSARNRKECGSFTLSVMSDAPGLEVRRATIVPAQHVFEGAFSKGAGPFGTGGRPGGKKFKPSKTWPKNPQLRIYPAEERGGVPARVRVVLSAVSAELSSAKLGLHMVRNKVNPTLPEDAEVLPGRFQHLVAYQHYAETAELSLEATLDKSAGVGDKNACQPPFPFFVVPSLSSRKLRGKFRLQVYADVRVRAEWVADDERRL